MSPRVALLTPEHPGGAASSVNRTEKALESLQTVRMGSSTEQVEDKESCLPSARSGMNGSSMTPLPLGRVHPRPMSSEHSRLGSTSRQRLGLTHAAFSRSGG
jgi:hypothetical protein